MKQTRIALILAAAVGMISIAGCAHKKVAQVTPPAPPQPAATPAPPPAPRAVAAQPAPAPVAATAPSLDELFNRAMKDVYFDYDKYAIRSDDEGAVETAAQFLEAHPEVQVTIEGHCDDRGSDEYNLALGDSRASALRSRLLTSGVKSTQLKTVSYGKEKPFCTAADENCWQKNRRDHYVLAAAR